MKDEEQQSLFGSGSVVDVDHAKKFEVPTVDTVPVVHAHYIYKNFDDYECSNCHIHCHIESICTIYDNYCPNCGAKMDEKTEEKK